MTTESTDPQKAGAITAGAKRVMELTQHNYLAILATVYPSGGPQAFPIWYHYDGATFSFATEATASQGA